MTKATTAFCMAASSSLHTRAASPGGAKAASTVPWSTDTDSPRRMTRRCVNGIVSRCLQGRISEFVRQSIHAHVKDMLANSCQGRDSRGRRIVGRDECGVIELEALGLELVAMAG